MVVLRWAISTTAAQNAANRCSSSASPTPAANARETVRGERPHARRRYSRGASSATVPPAAAPFTVLLLLLLVVVAVEEEDKSGGFVGVDAADIE